MRTKLFTPFAVGLALGITSLATSFFLPAAIAQWTAPTQAPPNGNLPAPIFQDPLFIDTVNDRVGVNSVTPRTDFDVIGDAIIGDGPRFGDELLTLRGTSGDNDAVLVAELWDSASNRNPAFSILPWTSQVYISSGIYYSNGAWRHNSDDGNNQILVMDPGGGVRWYASNNSAGSWNVSNNNQLWDDSANWTGLIRSTRAGNSYFTGGNFGIGTNAPNRQLHVYQASGNNAEIDIQSVSGAGQHWGIYHDRATDDLYFWNNDIPGSKHGLIIGNDGSLTANENYVPTNNKDLATKEYVDAAGGGGDATLANQETILSNQNAMKGTSFVSNTNSLRALSDKQSTILSTVQQLQTASAYTWLAQANHFSVGGDPAFCKKKSVDLNGIATVSNINTGAICNTTTGEQCVNGQCGTPLIGTAHTTSDCTSNGGTSYNTGSGWICKFTANTCPAGWTQHQNYQQYSAIGWGDWPNGDLCGRWVDSGPTTFQNLLAQDNEPSNAPNIEMIGGTTCESGNTNTFRTVQNNPGVCGGEICGKNTHDDMWCPDYYDGNFYNSGYFCTYNNPSANRTAIGCK